MNSRQLLISGMLLLIAPSLFFISVVMEVVFHNNFLVENIFVALDKSSNLFSIALLYLFPITAFALNFIPFVKFRLKNENESISFGFAFKKQPINLGIALIGFIFASTITCYLITENLQGKL